MKRLTAPLEGDQEFYALPSKHLKLILKSHPSHAL